MFAVWRWCRMNNRWEYARRVSTTDAERWLQNFRADFPGQWFVLSVGKPVGCDDSGQPHKVGQPRYRPAQLILTPQQDIDL